MLEIKTGGQAARLFALSPQIIMAVMVGVEIWRKEGRVLVCTSGAEGRHAGKTRGHARGMAVDFRSKPQRQGIDGLDGPLRVAYVVSELKRCLGPDYQVLAEVAPEHIHVEYLPQDIEP